MKIFLAYFIPLILFVIGMRFDKSKIVTFLFLTYFWILMGLNTNSPDYSSYEMYYFYTSSFKVEWGFKFLCNLFRNAGLTYQQFRMVYAAIYSCLAIATAKRLSSHINYILAMFLLMPFVLNVSGIRFALASMIVCFGIPYLLPRQKIGNFKYIICVIIASLFHKSVIFYLVFLFAKKRYKILQYCLMIVAVIISAFLIRSSILLNIVLKYYPNVTLIKWLSLNNTGIGRLNLTGFLVNVFFVIAFPMLISALTKLIMKSHKKDLVEDAANAEEGMYQQLILYKNISIYGLLAIPGYLISSEYQRFLFGVLMVYYSTFASFKYSRLNMRGYKKMMYKFIILILVVLLLALYIYSMQSHDVFATFRDNMLFQ